MHTCIVVGQIPLSRRDGCWLVGFMVFNATSNYISVITWQLVLLVEETGVPGENYRRCNWDPIDLINSATWLCLSLVNTWILNERIALSYLSKCFDRYESNAEKYSVTCVQVTKDDIDNKMLVRSGPLFSYSVF
jgi:hypothetical protein